MAKLRVTEIAPEAPIRGRSQLTLLVRVDGNISQESIEGVAEFVDREQTKFQETGLTCRDHILLNGDPNFDITHLFEHRVAQRVVMAKQRGSLLNRLARNLGIISLFEVARVQAVGVTHKSLEGEITIGISTNYSG